MEAPAEQPLVSPALALELLRAPPAPIPKSDPLLVGRSCLLCPQTPGDTRREDTAKPPPPSAVAGFGQSPCREASATATATADPHQHHADRGVGGYRQLPSHAAADLSYDEFVRQYMAPNNPVVIRGVTSGWRAAAEWRTADGRLRLEALKQLAGHCTVCVTDTSNQDDGCGCVRTLTLSEYLAWWDLRAATAPTAQQQSRHQQQPQQAGCGCPAAVPSNATKAAAEPSAASADAECCLVQEVHDHEEPILVYGVDGRGEVDTEQYQVADQVCGGGSDRCEASGGGGGKGGGLMYLKDWHFVAEFPSYGAYHLPVYFANDWLNAFYDHLAEQQQKGTVPRAGCSARASDPGTPRGSDGSPTTVGAAGGAKAPTRPPQDGDGTAALSCEPPLPAPPQRQRQPPDEALAASSPPPLPADGSHGDAGGSGGGPVPAAFTSDYRFVYLGPAGTWTPLHSDVLRSHSWSANVCGRKRWLLLDPGSTHLLYDRHMTRLAPHLELDRARSDCDPRDFPGLQEARRRAYEFIQEAGDAVFVPSGWHHCVENLQDTLSVNHNWLNGHNCHWTWRLLRQQYLDAAEAIEDCRELCSPDEFEGLVQGNLAANMGLDWRGFVSLLGCAARRALVTLRSGGPRTAGGGGDGGGGCAWGSAEALAAGREVMNALLELQRAGAVLVEVVAAYEELVIAPTEKLARRCRSQRCDELACRLLRQSPITDARVLLADIADELGFRGLTV